MVTAVGPVFSSESLLPDEQEAKLIVSAAHKVSAKTPKNLLIFSSPVYLSKRKKAPHPRKNVLAWAGALLFLC